MKAAQRIADAPAEVKAAWDKAEHTLTKAIGSTRRALRHSCHGRVPALLGLWGEGRAGLEGKGCVGRSLHAPTYSWDAAACCSSGGLDFVLQGGPCQPLSKDQLWQEQSLARLNVGPPGSMKAAPSLLPMPSVPPLLFACTRARWALPNSAGAQDPSETEWSCVSFLV